MNAIGLLPALIGAAIIYHGFTGREFKDEFGDNVSPERGRLTCIFVGSIFLLIAIGMLFGKGP